MPSKKSNAQKARENEEKHLRALEDNCTRFKYCVRAVFQNLNQVRFDAKAEISVRFTFENDNEARCLGSAIIPWRWWRNSLTHMEYGLQDPHPELERCLINHFNSNANLLKGIVASHVF